MIPDRNVMDEHAKDIVVNDELLLSNPKTFTSAIAQYTELEMLDVFSLCVFVEVCRSHQ